MNIQPQPERTKNRILDYLSRSQDILSLPAVVQEILEVTTSRRASSRDLIRIIEGDQKLCDKLLSATNSSYYGFTKKAATITHALAVLGFEEIEKIVLGIAVVKRMGRRGTEFNEKLWTHSFAVGAATRMIAKYLKLRPEAKHFVGGMLHDIGKIFFNHYLPDIFDDLLSAMHDEENTYTYHALERRFFGLTHAEVGGWLLNTWRFPQEITDVITMHHDKQPGGTDPLFLAMVHLADIIVTQNRISPVWDYSFKYIHQDMLEPVFRIKKNFNTEDVRVMIRQLDLEIEKQNTFASVFR